MIPAFLSTFPPSSTSHFFSPPPDLFALPPPSSALLSQSPLFYEGKFIGLPGAVSRRWPVLLKPQQGFTLHMEKHQHIGHTGPFSSPKHHTWYRALTSHYYLLMSITPFLPSLLHRVITFSEEWIVVFLPPALPCFSLYTAPSSICFLLVYEEQLGGGELVCLTSTYVVLFFFFFHVPMFKSAQPVPRYIIYGECHPSLTNLFSTL